MSLRYSAHYTEPLLPLVTTQFPLTGIDSRTEQLYRQIDPILKPPFTAHALQDALTLLQNDVALHASEQQHSSETVLQAVLAKITFGLYANALDLYLDQASAAQDDAEWWAEVEQSNRLAALYLLQTLPKRVLNLLRVLRSSDGSLHLSTFRLSSLNDVFSTVGRLQPNPFVSILFPHLKGNPSGTLTRIHPVFYVDPQSSASTILPIFRDAIKRLVNGFTFALYFPLRLSRDECRLKRQEHEKIRNDSAEVLGKLIGMRPALVRALAIKRDSLSTKGAPGPDFLVEFVAALVLVTRKKEHASYLDDRDLRRPSRLTLMWPRLLLLPPLTLYCVKTLYASRATLTDLAVDTLETIHNFVTGWLLEPLREVFRTIRAGGEEGVIVRRSAVSADLNSLERMALALAQDKLGYTQAQLTALSNQIRMGDLTPILEIYEGDIKRPFKSAIAGTLLRSLFVQVQKAKVDIDQALTGIDKLLKSQELTFAFVGVAPALAIVYVVGGSLKQLVFGGRHRYGGKHHQMSVWLAMRRIERLLLFQPHRDADQPRDVEPSTNSIPPLTTGLLVLSLTHLRKYALTSLPARSRLREGFLEDVQDMEDPSLGRWEKLRVLEGMWRSWGRELGWYEVAGSHGCECMSPSSYGYAYLTSYGWTGTGTGLRKGAIAKPLAIPPKKNLSGLGKDRDEAFPFWDHLFAAASKAITIKVSSDDEDADESKDHTDDPPTPLARTTTGILSNRRPVSGTPASTSGITTPRPNTDADRDIPNAGAEGRLSLLATAKREAAKRGLYARFFRGAVLGPDDDSCGDNASHSGSLSCEASRRRREGESKKRKAEDRAETKEERRERKRLKRERKAAKAAKKAAKGCKDNDKKDRKAQKYQDEKTQSEANEASHIRKKTRKQAQKVVTSNGQDTLSHRPSSDMDATDVLNIVLTTKKKAAKRKDTLS
ncbi:ATP synthase regulation protein NCA2-domain-containing protein [Boletus reticuloceps]|uniref:ATP synthase regulation protein NCA2-domain-containing protein n=1 Tax=Boletus reticuloceps TaxID=495285 RepID=A0A8I3A9P0_9AGAM|nr:ATP synthase regulation protein NCA2-domain-containing protein [Boletus reticuloceps]